MERRHYSLAVGSLRERDRVLLELLARFTRVLSVGQVKEIAGSERAARRWLARLERESLVERYQVVARPLAPPRCIFRFNPGDPEPDFRKLSQALCDRHRGHGRTVSVARLSATGARLFGLRKQPRRVRASETTHDLQLASVALALWHSGSVRRWRTEDELHGEWYGVLPDAEVTLRTGERFVLEGGGAYSAAKLAHFHEHVAPELEERRFSSYAIC